MIFIISARPVSTGYVNINVLGVHSTWNRLTHSYIRLSRRALTTATLSWQARQKRRPTNCNECWAQQPAWSAVCTSSTEACRDSSIPSYIGWMFLSESCTLYKLGVMVFNCLHGQATPTLKLHSNGLVHGNTVISTLAVDGWAVTFGTARKELGGLRPRPVPSSLYQMQQPTHQRPVYQLHIIPCGATIASEF